MLPAAADDDRPTIIEVEDMSQPEGGLGSPNCGTSLLDRGEMQCIGDWQKGSLQETGGLAGGFPSDLDTFFSRVYDYTKERGYACIVATRVVNLLALTFMVIFSGFLGLFVNWKVVLGCNSASTCDEADMFNPQPFAQRWVIQHGKPIQVGAGYSTFFVVIFLLVCSVFLLLNAWRYLRDLKEFYGIKRFMNDRLKISERDMGTIEWNEVVSKMISLQESGVLVTKNKITPLDITNRIMRKENYFIAMINKGAVCVDFPWLGRWMPPVLTKTMEWNLNYCILGHMFDQSTHSVKQRFIANPDSLKRRFVWMGILNLLLAPFIAIFALLYSFFKHGQTMHKNPASLGARHWSPLSSWKLREFNELDLFFDKRLNASYKPANDYVEQFPSTQMSIIAKFFIFIASSFCGVIVVLSLIDESVLLYAKIGDRNLLWYLAIFGMMIAAARPFVVDRHTNFEPDQAFARVVEQTHYYPSRWRGKVHSPDTYDAFSTMFPLKIQTFFNEIISIFVVPLMLIFVLPKQAKAITDFVRDFTETRPVLGDVCSFAVFDFERHGNAKYGAHVPHDKYYRSSQGKMEKSFLTFLENNPNWVPSEDGQQLVQKVKAQQELSKSMDSFGPVQFGTSSMHSSLDDVFLQSQNQDLE